jgi:hypothetical protein
MVIMHRGSDALVGFGQGRAVVLVRVNNMGVTIRRRVVRVRIASETMLKTGWRGYIRTGRTGRI